jgi:organic hydroperoxide reductase OsmC/OhrA
LDSIESSSYPLIYKVAAGGDFPLKAPIKTNKISVRAATRALSGMQKECVLHYEPTNTTWRMVCDEGPWLNGTDLASFPLGFFTAGLVSSYMSEYLSHVKKEGIKLHSLEVMVDNIYTMEGSLIRGTMSSDALPVEVTFRANAEADDETLQSLAYKAVASSPADVYLRAAKDSVFSLNMNDKQIPVTGVAISPSEQTADPSVVFKQACPDNNDSFKDERMEKLANVDSLGGEILGTERATGKVGLSDVQKRKVHVRGVGTLRSDGLKDIHVACFQPIGSVFRFLSDDSELVGGQGRAPSGLAYFSAGLSFCFMTQLGRYAAVTRQKMNSYQVVQDMTFSLPSVDDESESAAVDTHVFIGTEEDDAATQKLLDMGEQTCYLHAACRSAIKTRIRFRKAEQVGADVNIPLQAGVA